MSEGVRVIGPDRAQLRWDTVDLDSQLPDDHRARLVWAFVEGLDLREFYDRIEARDAVAGRPAADPRVVLAVWLYATLEGIGSARAIDRLCQQHAAYRWLCGGAPINHDLLAEFRREHAALLDRLLTQSVTGLIAEKLITLEELMIDGTKVRAYAGRGSLCKRKRLERIEQAVAERVAELKSELDTDPGEPERRRKKRALQAAEERVRRVERARQRLAELEQEKAARAKTHPQEEAEKSEPKVSVSDPEVRSMRLADGAVAPAWNVQVATANGFIIAVDPTDRRKDSGLAPGMVAKVGERCGQVPQRLLADTTSPRVAGGRGAAAQGPHAMSKYLQIAHTFKMKSSRKDTRARKSGIGLHPRRQEECVELRVERLDARNQRIGQFDRRQPTAFDQSGSIGDCQPMQICRGCGQIMG